MAKFFKAIGNWEPKMDLAYGNLQKEILMKVVGIKIGSMGRVFLSTELAHTRASLKIF